jgi:lysine-N-methylase
MCIDKDTLDKYKNNDSSFSSALKKGINFGKSKFRADRQKRCAFLNDKNLCDIIINMGEQGLCQVCADHPRFRSFFADRTETGLGFCCEEATKIILSYKDKIQPILAQDDGLNEELDFIEKSLLEFRKRAIDIIQDRNADINQRIKNLLSLCSADINEVGLKKLQKLLLSLEHIDKTWIKKLKQIKKTKLNLQINDQFSHFAEQFLVNSIYRHVSSAEDTMWARGVVVSFVLCFLIIQGLAVQEISKGENVFNAVAETIRTFSAEVEYSQKNLNKLFNFTNKLIKI